jgi:hypothetical protein
MSSSLATGLGRSYSITSSARASNVGGISMPSAFAVLRLMTSSMNTAPLARGFCFGPRPRRSAHHVGSALLAFGHAGAFGLRWVQPSPPPLRSPYGFRTFVGQLQTPL